jgi:hypothetical protein
MKLRNVLAKEVYLRLSRDEEVICTTRYAGFRVFVRRFRVTQIPRISPGFEEPVPGPIVRQTEPRIGACRQFEE